MIIPIILIILILISLLCLFVSRDEGGDFLFANLLILAICAAPLVMSVTSHTSDLSLIRKGHALVEIREQAIKDIDNQLKQINITNSALMNADSPTRSLVETRTKFISELTDQRLSIENARIDIETRSIGLMKMVVWIYGKE